MSRRIFREPTADRIHLTLFAIAIASHLLWVLMIWRQERKRRR